MAQQQTPDQILQAIYKRAATNLAQTVIDDTAIQERVDYVCRCTSNRAGVRLLMSCLLVKLHNPAVDPRKPYTEIGGNDSFSGRTYDERFLTKFISEHRLPANSTTAFLTPTLRNIDYALTTDRELVGKPRDLYKKTLQLLEDVAENRISADLVFVETVRILLKVRDEKLSRMASLIDSLKRTEGSLPLSSEAIVTLIGQHLACKKASRLPVMIVAAAYETAGARLAERMLPLASHNAADLQTGSLGDVEICLIDDDAVVTVYEMKMKSVTVDDIDAAITKITRSPKQINNYLFVTTDKIDPYVAEYAATFYEETGGTELAILDCIGFLRHFLHLFHRVRVDYLNAYQTFVLNEPDSAVSQTLKEAFLALRQAAESGE
ncbi:MAG: DNA methyltransferase [Deltaproteobacteria bacterium CG17_big_fil_post_rev_8_21_14_2_50_51_6]|nr:MAG: DNA methyltransferase [Desulfobacterales bacterium CG07_land_8_20_14_0_80_52_14]PIW01724.1 MAG: DNA methyltransferase [Deltaproteobacteria bacterium CG17_big_fil_post_rev_8_21_14_2_50_51_6]PJB37265.1 MAG: DNA methyltransferase [Deltaproteobacteria bacterium CG_4_9_14_3_um_filter_51_14]